MLNVRGSGLILGLLMMVMLSACSARGSGGQEPTAAVEDLPETATAVSAGDIPPGQLRNVAYVEGGDRTQKLDIYLPLDANAPFPVLLAIHGGHGDKHEMAPLAEYFSERGYAVVTINFRDMPQHSFPAPVEDAFCALGWVYANAQYYGFDTTRIAAVGFSAGADFAAMLGAVDDAAPFLTSCPYNLPFPERVAAVITFTGVFDLRAAAQLSAGHLDYYNRFVGDSQENAPEQWDAASVMSWVTGGEPPFLLIHGAADDNILPSFSEHFAAVLEESGVRVSTYFVEGETHMGIIRNEDAFGAAEAFLLETLR